MLCIYLSRRDSFPRFLSMSVRSPLNPLGKVVGASVFS